MRNRYPGICYRCGKNVEAGAGHFERLPHRGWRVQHADCAIKFRGQADAITEERNRLAARRRHKSDEERAMGTGKGAQRARRRLREKAMAEGATS